MKEIIKLLHVRTYVSGLTLHDLEKNVRRFLSELSTAWFFKAAIIWNETRGIWQAIFFSFMVSDRKPYMQWKDNRFFGKTLAGGNPFIYQILKNILMVLYWALQLIDGNSFLIFFMQMNEEDYNASVAGLIDFGKSTLSEKAV